MAEAICRAAGTGPGRAAALLAETARTGEERVTDPVADLGLGRPHFPEPSVVGADAGGGWSDAAAAAAVCEAGMLARDLDHNRRAMDQLDYEPASSAA
ncbi:MULTISPECIES: hypothetical protein [unclassified Streptomyces]|uniref:hypothetical protein n=1 Tax=unclassified Streptomyces TaxID=2593676 RepID=UPI002E0D48D4|nr:MULTISPECIES: hypothetical protein [unclassified Streptomyces]WSJ27587.1 hypothetical protein OG384_36740 [Streptomyces sp. NBC_01324]